MKCKHIATEATDRRKESSNEVTEHLCPREYVAELSNRNPPLSRLLGAPCTIVRGLVTFDQRRLTARTQIDGRSLHEKREMPLTTDAGLSASKHDFYQLRMEMFWWPLGTGCV